MNKIIKAIIVYEVGLVQHVQLKKNNEKRNDLAIRDAINDKAIFPCNLSNHTSLSNNQFFTFNRMTINR